MKNPVFVSCVNPGNGMTKMYNSCEGNAPTYHLMPSAIAYPTTQDAQEERVHLDVLTTTNLMFGADAIRFNRQSAIPRMSEDPFTVFFTPGERTLNADYYTKLLGPLAKILTQTYHVTACDLVLSVVVCDDHRIFKDDLVRELTRKHVLKLDGQPELTVNVVKTFVLSETYAGINSQMLRYDAGRNTITQEKRYLEQITAVVNAGMHTSDVTIYYPRMNNAGERFLVGGTPRTDRLGNWRIIESGDVKRFLLERFGDRVTALDAWSQVDILQSKVLPGKDPVDLREALKEFFGRRAGNYIKFVQAVTGAEKDLSELLAIGGGWHDYREHVLTNVAFQHIPVVQVGRDETGSDQNPEKLAALGGWQLARRYYDLKYARGGERHDETTVA